MRSTLTQPRPAAPPVPAEPPSVRFRGVGKVHGGGAARTTALAGVDLDVAPGEFVTIVGPSGCGKSTLLNIAAGLDKPTAGGVEVAGGQPAMVFQDAALFPWLTVGGNIEAAFKLGGHGYGRAERRQRVAELLELVRLPDLEGRRPHELSGGMRQRVAIARALAQQADVLLMDEPFGALDALTRGVLHGELERIWRERGIAILFVTHDVHEAVRLGDRVVVLGARPGRILHDLPVTLERPRSDGRAAAELVSRVTAALHGPAHD
jgi:NitT/TauT family transport system ATP-binding protein